MLQMADIANLRDYDDLAIVDHDYYGNRDFIDNIPVIGSEQSYPFDQNCDYFLAVNWFPEKSEIQIRNKQKRNYLIDLLHNKKIRCVNLIHPTAIVPKTVHLGQGIMICSGAIIGNHCTVDDFVQIREHAYLAHHAVIKKNSVIQVYGYVGSDVTVGRDCYIGIRSSCVKKNSIIQDNTFIKSHVLHNN